jgi:hypothetical protein
LPSAVAGTVGRTPNDGSSLGALGDSCVPERAETPCDAYWLALSSTQEATAGASRRRGVAASGVDLAPPPVHVEEMCS